MVKPPSTLSPFQARSIILNHNVLQRARHVINVPIDDTMEQVCVVPDRDDGAVSYQRLFDALYEYYHHDPRRLESVDEHTAFGGIMVIGSRLVVNLI